MTAPLTALYAGVLGLLLLALAARVSLLRSKLRVGMGHGNDPHLARAIRVHGNAIEWILLMLLLFLVAELDGANRIFLHACGVTFVGARIAHAAGLSRTSKESSGRFWGTAATWLVIAVLAVWDIAAFARTGLGFLR
ncbi:MAG TPA: MAPEG family protein [Casimicrobiaceae bacterium]|nr:MAPEG family protein [Casimicrobiaceae bacterium]